MTIFVFIITSILLVSLMLALIKLITMNMETNYQKWTSFECGFLPQTSSMPSFSMQFFLIMILFLIFDIEVSLLFPFPLSNMNTSLNLTMTIFILILLIGLMLEWFYKKLSWAS